MPDEPQPSQPPSGSPDASAPVGGVRVRIAGYTDVGLVRDHNEDNFLISYLTPETRAAALEVRTAIVGARGTLLAVCDGMGGAAAGEIASQMAVDTIRELVRNGPQPANRDEFAQRMTAAIDEANARIYLAAKSNRRRHGMGTTSTVAGAFGTTLFVGQVGDSRAYLVRGGRIKQITKDQSLVAKLIETGQLTEAEAQSHEQSNVILQALGTSDTVSVDLSFMDLRRGDCLLLCSDGLSGLVSSVQMAEVISTTDEPKDCCEQLTQLANRAGGHDNVTVIVARFDGDIPELGPGDEYFGHQPYVIENPIEPPRAAPASRKIVRADAPPPGKDVKFALSMRPPSMTPEPPEALPPATTADTEPPPDEELQLPVSRTPRAIPDMMWILVALALIATAVYFRSR